MNSTRYQPLMGVQVQHGYFEPGRTRHLVFDPCELTQRLMRQFDVLMRFDGANLELHARADRLDGLRSECTQAGGVLRFQLRSTDPACGLYTAPLEADRVAEFVPDPDRRGQLMLQTRPRTGTAPPSPSTVLGELMLPLEPVAAEDASSRTWLLQIAARSTIWKYWLLGDWLDRELTLVDLAGQIEFAQPVSEALPDGRTATVIRSRTAIALQERPPQRFQLRDARSTPPKVLVPRMPAAAPGGLGREWQSGDTALVAEIFLSR